MRVRDNYWENAVVCQCGDIVFNVSCPDIGCHLERSGLDKKTTIRYSEAFKLQVLRELETGKFSTVAEAQRAYGIRGSETIPGWIRRYGKSNLQRKVVRVQTPNERDELKRLMNENRRLKEALADAQWDKMLGDAYLEIACRTAGIADVDDFKKKHAGRR